MTIPHRLKSWRFWILAALFCLGAWRYCASEDPYGRRGGGVMLDGFYYYIHLHSLLHDGDLDLENDYHLQGYDVAYKETEAGRRANPFSVGPAILWAPFLLLAHLLVLLRVSLGEAGLSLSLMSEFHQHVTLFSTYLYGCAAIWICYRLLCRLFGEGVALWSALGVGLGGPLVYYMVACPSYSHAQSAFVYSLFVWCWLAFREQLRAPVRQTDQCSTWGRWAALGLLAGLTTLMHPGNCLLALLPAGTVLGHLWRSARAGDGRALARTLAGSLVAVALALLTFLPQMLAWKAIYGQYLLTPQGEGFMRFGESMWHATLFSPRNGLLPHAPVFALCLAGLLWMLRRMPGLAASCLLVLSLLALVNGAVYDWWGWGFGARRYTVALPLFAIGLGFLMQQLGALVVRHQRLLIRGLVPAVLLFFVGVNLQIFREFRKGKLDGSGQVPTRETYRIALAGFLRDVGETIGNPLSWPSNWIFALRHGVDVQRYDLVHGFHFLDDNHVGANPHDPKLDDKLDLTRTWPERFLVRGWSQVSKLEGIKVRPANAPVARLLLPLNVHKGIGLSFRMKPGADNTRLEILFNGEPVLDKTLTGGWQSVSARVEPRLIRRGTNLVELRHHFPAQGERRRSRDIGTTGRRSPVDIAAVGAGVDQGDFADIWVNGRRHCANRRGLNITQVDPHSGEVLAVRGFDVHRNRHASAALRRFIEHMPEGAIVAVASRDEASRRFTGNAKEALRLIGLKTDLADKYRQAYAAIGVRGAPPGTALEQLQPKKHRAHIYVGRAPPPWRVMAWYEKLDLTLDK